MDISFVPQYNPGSKVQKMIIWSIGWFFNNVILNYGWDYFLYPFVIWKLGIVVGGTIMMVVSTLACYFLLLFYDWSKKDWLGIETIKGFREEVGRSRIRRLINWVLNKGDAAALILLSVQFDPFITTAYMRHGSHQYNGLSKRDWKIFFLSAVVANLYWLGVSYIGIHTIISVVQWVKGIF